MIFKNFLALISPWTMPTLCRYDTAENTWREYKWALETGHGGSLNLF